MRASCPSSSLGGFAISTNKACVGSIVGATCLLVSSFQLWQVTTRPTDWLTFLNPAEGVWDLDSTRASFSRSDKAKNHSFVSRSESGRAPQRTLNLSEYFRCCSTHACPDPPGAWLGLGLRLSLSLRPFGSLSRFGFCRSLLFTLYSPSLPGLHFKQTCRNGIRAGVKKFNFTQPKTRYKLRAKQTERPFD